MILDEVKRVVQGYAGYLNPVDGMAKEINLNVKYPN